MEKSVFPLRRDLGIQLSTLYLAFVGVVLIAAFFFARSASQQLQADTSSADLALANAIAQETHTAMSSALEAVRQIADYPAIIANDPTGMQDIFRTAMSARTDVNLVYRLDAKGIMTFHYPVGPDSTVGTDFSFRPYYQRALISHTPFLSSGRISPTTNQPVATAIMPLWSEDGRFLGLVAMNIKLQFLSDTLTDIATTSYTNQRVQVAILDQDGQIVAHSEPHFLLQNGQEVMPQVTQKVLVGQTGNLITEDQGGDQQIYSYTPIEDIGWGVIVNRPTASAFAVLYAFRQGIFIVIAIFLSSGLIFWGILFNRVIRPLERLAILSQAVWPQQQRSGDISAALAEFTTHRADQMGVLTRSLQNMQQAIEARLKELSTLLKTSAAVVSSLDSQTVLDRILEQVEQLLGMQMSVIFILDEEAHMFRVKASRHMPAWYAEKVMIDPQDPNSVAMRAIRTGEPIQVSDTETDPSYAYIRHRSRQAGYRAILAIKLSVQHVPSAVLLVCHTEPHIFTEREIRLLTNFANHATMAIENAALYARSDMHLQEQTRRLEALIGSMHDGLVLEDSEGYILYANRRVQELIGLPAEAIFQKPIRLLVDALIAQTADSEAVKMALAENLSRQGIRRLEFEQKGEKQTRYLGLTLFDVRDASAELIGRGWIFEDTTQRYVIDRMRSILIATVSHELRTPLAAIKGYASTLLVDDVEWDTASQREFLTIISQETDRLSTLVQDLLDMSRIEAGSLKLKRVMCSLPTLINQAAQHAAPKVAERVRIDFPPDLPSVYVDPQRIEAVLRNLIENAAKYCPDETPIQVSASLQEDQLVIRVTDEGSGISPDQQGRVFESFYRVEEGLARQAAGSGLAIARSFVQVHGGRIWLESSEKGTCVGFSIPLEEETEAI